MSIFGDDFFDSVDRHHAQRRAEFEKLACEPCVKEAKVGDRVLCAAGPLGMGFEWERHEATVIEVADTAYKVRFAHRKEYGTDMQQEVWAHKFVITDVLN